MAFKLFASRATYASSNSKELRAIEVETGEEAVEAQCELWNDGYEINDIWYPSDESEKVAPKSRDNRRRR